jgi:hypothetical protein
MKYPRDVFPEHHDMEGYLLQLPIRQLPTNPNLGVCLSGMQTMAGIKEEWDMCADDTSSIHESSMEEVKPPGPATNGRFYYKDERIQSVMFDFRPDPPGLSLDHQWAALLSIKCDDVPRLMRDGFFWSEDNLIPEEGYIDYSVKGRYYRRHYFLEDKKKRRLWIANIIVKAPSVEAIFRFDLGQLSIENMQKAGAISQNGYAIYGYHYNFPSLCFNAIYDNMELPGWWPWPPKEL